MILAQWRAAADSLDLPKDSSGLINRFVAKWTKNLKQTEEGNFGLDNDDDDGDKDKNGEEGGGCKVS